MYTSGRVTTQYLPSYGKRDVRDRSSKISRVDRLLPKWLPFHPSRWWIHTRTVYVPMSYLYGVRFKAAEDLLILALREVGAER